MPTGTVKAPPKSPAGDTGSSTCRDPVVWKGGILRPVGILIAMTGEEAHDIGREGIAKARRWLDLTTRVAQAWTNVDQPMAELLQFAWPHGTGTFSFDIGGTFRGGALDGQSFVAEVKHVKNSKGLKSQFHDFLAKCYIAIQAHPKRCDNFLWVAWSPFEASKWDRHGDASDVRDAVLKTRHLQHALGTSDEAEAIGRVDANALAAVASRIWLVTMNDRQNSLVLTEDHFSLIVAHILSQGGT